MKLQGTVSQLVLSRHLGPRFLALLMTLTLVVSIPADRKEFMETQGEVVSIAGLSVVRETSELDTNSGTSSWIINVIGDKSDTHIQWDGL